MWHGRNISKVNLAATFVVVAIHALCSAGCRGNKSADQGTQNHAATIVTKPPLNIIGVDVSGSTAKWRAQQVSFLRVAYAQAGKYSENVIVYAVDSKTACIQGQLTCRHNEQPGKSVIDAVLKPPSKRSEGTKPLLFWQEALAECERANHASTIRIQFVGDGDNDSPSDAAQIAETAANLARRQNVTVGMFGLDKDNYKTVSTQFADFGSTRSVFTIDTDKATMLKGLSDQRLLEGGQAK